MSSLIHTARDFLAAIKPSTAQYQVGKAQELIDQLNSEENEIFKKLQNAYSVVFPELASLSLSARDYALTVKHLSQTLNESLKTILHPTTAIAVVLAYSTSIGSKQVNGDVVLLAQNLLDLTQIKAKVAVFLESSLSQMAPNLTALLGAGLAGKLLALTGGLRQLSTIPANNLQVIGRDPSKQKMHRGLLATSDLIMNVADEWQGKALRLLAAKTALACRFDLAKTAPGGNQGRSLRESIISALDKAAQPNDILALNKSTSIEPHVLFEAILPEEVNTQATLLTATAISKPVKALPPPDAKPARKRAGRRRRRAQALLGITHVRRAANRVAFGTQAEHEIIVGDTVKGLGMLDASNSGIRDTTGHRLTVDSTVRERLKAKALEKLAAKRSSSSTNFVNPFSQ